MRIPKPASSSPFLHSCLCKASCWRTIRVIRMLALVSADDWHRLPRDMGSNGPRLYLQLFGEKNQHCESTAVPSPDQAGRFQVIAANGHGAELGDLEIQIVSANHIVELAEVDGESGVHAKVSRCATWEERVFPPSVTQPRTQILSAAKHSARVSVDFMGHAEVLWADILACPFDDLPKLVLADYLDERADYEQGDTRTSLALRWCLARGRWPRITGRRTMFIWYTDPTIKKPGRPAEVERATLPLVFFPGRTAM